MVEARVEYDFDPQNDDELTLRVGDIITNIVQKEGGWWEGKLKEKHGLFPDNFVKVLTKEQNKNSEQSKADSNGVQLRKDKKRKCRVVYSYTPVNDDELELQVDTLIDVLEEVEEGWWKGVLNGRVGVFPSNFVEETDTTGSSHIESRSSKENVSDGPDKGRDSGGSSSNQIKPKPVRGVGLGNIFQDEMIKLKPAQDAPSEKKAVSTAPKKPPLPASSIDAPMLPPKPVVSSSSCRSSPSMIAMNESHDLSLKPKDTELKSGLCCNLLSSKESEALKFCHDWVKKIDTEDEGLVTNNKKPVAIESSLDLDLRLPLYLLEMPSPTSSSSQLKVPSWTSSQDSQSLSSLEYIHQASSEFLPYLGGRGATSSDTSDSYQWGLNTTNSESAYPAMREARKPMSELISRSSGSNVSLKNCEKNPANTCPRINNQTCSGFQHGKDSRGGHLSKPLAVEKQSKSSPCFHLVDNLKPDGTCSVSPVNVTDSELPYNFVKLDKCKGDFVNGLQQTASSFPHIPAGMSDMCREFGAARDNVSVSVQSSFLHKGHKQNVIRESFLLRSLLTPAKLGEKKKLFASCSLAGKAKSLSPRRPHSFAAGSTVSELGNPQLVTSHLSKHCLTTVNPIPAPRFHSLLISSPHQVSFCAKQSSVNTSLMFNSQDVEKKTNSKKDTALQETGQLLKLHKRRRRKVVRRLNFESAEPVKEHSPCSIQLVPTKQQSTTVCSQEEGNGILLQKTTVQCGINQLIDKEEVSFSDEIREHPICKDVAVQVEKLLIGNEAGGQQAELRQSVSDLNAPLEHPITIKGTLSLPESGDYGGKDFKDLHDCNWLGADFSKREITREVDFEPTTDPFIKRYCSQYDLAARSTTPRSCYEDGGFDQYPQYLQETASQSSCLDLVDHSFCYPNRDCSPGRSINFSSHSHNCWKLHPSQNVGSGIATEWTLSKLSNAVVFDDETLSKHKPCELNSKEANALSITEEEKGKVKFHQLQLPSNASVDMLPPHYDRKCDTGDKSVKDVALRDSMHCKVIGLSRIRRSWSDSCLVKYHWLPPPASLSIRKHFLPGGARMTSGADRPLRRTMPPERVTPQKSELDAQRQSRHNKMFHQRLDSSIATIEGVTVNCKTSNDLNEQLCALSFHSNSNQSPETLHQINGKLLQDDTDANEITCCGLKKKSMRKAKSVPPKNQNASVTKVSGGNAVKSFSTVSQGFLLGNSQDCTKHALQSRSHTQPLRHSRPNSRHTLASPNPSLLHTVISDNSCKPTSGHCSPKSAKAHDFHKIPHVLSNNMISDSVDQEVQGLLFRDAFMAAQSVKQHSSEVLNALRTNLQLSVHQHEPYNNFFFQDNEHAAAATLCNEVQPNFVETAEGSNICMINRSGECKSHKSTAAAKLPMAFSQFRDSSSKSATSSTGLRGCTRTNTASYLKPTRDAESQTPPVRRFKLNKTHKEYSPVIKVSNNSVARAEKKRRFCSLSESNRHLSNASNITPCNRRMAVTRTHSMLQNTTTANSTGVAQNMLFPKNNPEDLNVHWPCTTKSFEHSDSGRIFPPVTQVKKNHTSTAQKKISECKIRDNSLCNVVGSHEFPRYFLIANDEFLNPPEKDDLGHLEQKQKEKGLHSNDNMMKTNLEAKNSRRVCKCKSESKSVDQCCHINECKKWNTAAIRTGQKCLPKINHCMCEVRRGIEDNLQKTHVRKLLTTSTQKKPSNNSCSGNEPVEGEVRVLASNPSVTHKQGRNSYNANRLKRKLGTKSHSAEAMYKRHSQSARDSLDINLPLLPDILSQASHVIFPVYFSDQNNMCMAWPFHGHNLGLNVCNKPGVRHVKRRKNSMSVRNKSCANSPKKSVSCSSSLSSPLKKSAIKRCASTGDRQLLRNSNSGKFLQQQKRRHHTAALLSKDSKRNCCNVEQLLNSSRIPLNSFPITKAQKRSASHHKPEMKDALKSDRLFEVDMPSFQTRQNVYRSRRQAFVKRNQSANDSCTRGSFGVIPVIKKFSSTVSMPNLQTGFSRNSEVDLPRPLPWIPCKKGSKNGKECGNSFSILPSLKVPIDRATSKNCLDVHLPKGEAFYDSTSTSPEIDACSKRLFVVTPNPLPLDFNLSAISSQSLCDTEVTSNEREWIQNTDKPQNVLTPAQLIDLAVENNILLSPASPFCDGDTKKFCSLSVNDYSCAACPQGTTDAEVLCPQGPTGAEVLCPQVPNGAEGLFPIHLPQVNICGTLHLPKSSSSIFSSTCSAENVTSRVATLHQPRISVETSKADQQSLVNELTTLPMYMQKTCAEDDVSTLNSYTQIQKANSVGKKTMQPTALLLKNADIVNMASIPVSCIEDMCKLSASLAETGQNSVACIKYENADQPISITEKPRKITYCLSRKVKNNLEVNIPTCRTSPDMVLTDALCSVNETCTQCAHSTLPLMTKTGSPSMANVFESVGTSQIVPVSSDVDPLKHVPVVPSSKNGTFANEYFVELIKDLLFGSNLQEMHSVPETINRSDTFCCNSQASSPYFQEESSKIGSAKLSPAASSTCPLKEIENKTLIPSQVAAANSYLAISPKCIQVADGPSSANVLKPVGSHLSQAAANICFLKEEVSKSPKPSQKIISSGTPIKKLEAGMPACSQIATSPCSPSQVEKTTLRCRETSSLPCSTNLEHVSSKLNLTTYSLNQAKVSNTKFHNSEESTLETTPLQPLNIEGNTLNSADHRSSGELETKLEEEMASTVCISQVSSQLESNVTPCSFGVSCTVLSVEKNSCPCIETCSERLQASFSSTGLGTASLAPHLPFVPTESKTLASSNSAFCSILPVQSAQEPEIDEKSFIELDSASRTALPVNMICSSHRSTSGERFPESSHLNAKFTAIPAECPTNASNTHCSLSPETFSALPSCIEGVDSADPNSNPLGISPKDAKTSSKPSCLVNFTFDSATTPAFAANQAKWDGSKLTSIHSLPVTSAGVLAKIPQLLPLHKKKVAEISGSIQTCSDSVDAISDHSKSPDKNAVSELSLAQTANWEFHPTVLEDFSSIQVMTTDVSEISEIVFSNLETNQPFKVSTTMAEQKLSPLSVELPEAQIASSQLCSDTLTRAATTCAAKPPPFPKQTHASDSCLNRKANRGKFSPFAELSQFNSQSKLCEEAISNVNCFFGDSNVCMAEALNLKEEECSTAEKSSFVIEPKLQQTEMDFCKKPEFIGGKQLSFTGRTCALTSHQLFPCACGTVQEKIMAKYSAVMPLTPRLVMCQENLQIDANACVDNSDECPRKFLPVHSHKLRTMAIVTSSNLTENCACSNDKSSLSNQVENDKSSIYSVEKALLERSEVSKLIKTECSGSLLPLSSDICKSRYLKHASSLPQLNQQSSLTQCAASAVGVSVSSDVCGPSLLPARSAVSCEKQKCKRPAKPPRKGSTLPTDEGELNNQTIHQPAEALQSIERKSLTSNVQECKRKSFWHLPKIRLHSNGSNRKKSHRALPTNKQHKSSRLLLETIGSQSTVPLVEPLLEVQWKLLSQPTAFLDNVDASYYDKQVEYSPFAPYTCRAPGTKYPQCTSPQPSTPLRKCSLTGCEEKELPSLTSLSSVCTVTNSKGCLNRMTNQPSSVSSWSTESCSTSSPILYTLQSVASGSTSTSIFSTATADSADSFVVPNTFLDSNCKTTTAPSSARCSSHAAQTLPNSVYSLDSYMNRLVETGRVSPSVKDSLEKYRVLPNKVCKATDSDQPASSGEPPPIPQGTDFSETITRDSDFPAS